VESREKLREPAWISSQADREARTDRISFGERMGQLVAVAGFLVVIVFVAIHQTRPTGFFTDDFGTLASVLLYGALVIGIVPLLVRFYTGRKNVARPFELIGFFPFLVGQLYFLVVFPFEFDHFADPLPRSLEFLLDWISPTLAKIVLGIGVVGSIVFMIYNSFLYLGVKDRLAKAEAAAERPAEETKSA